MFLQFAGYLKFSHEFSVDIIFENKCQAAMPNPVFPPENSPTVAQIKDEQVVVLGMKSYKVLPFQERQEVVKQDGVLAHGIHPDLIKGPGLEAYAVATAKNIGVVEGMQILIDQHATVGAGGQPRIGEKRGGLHPQCQKR